MVFWEGKKNSYRWRRDPKCFLLGPSKGSAFVASDNPSMFALIVYCVGASRRCFGKARRTVIAGGEIQNAFY